MSPSDELTHHAGQFRASGLLGKPGTLSRLFDFLLARSLEGDAPKETEIALQVFGKSPGFDVSQDAVVRVYVHKLRRRLEEFNARTPGGAKIVIPKGEYRLLLELPAVEPVAATTAPPVAPSRRASWLGIGIAVCCALVVGALLGTGFSAGGAQWDMREVRHSAVWAPLLEDDLPITIVVGDYYLLGEANSKTGHIDRLVREFFINSHEDFRDHAELNPQLMQRYRNLDLTYLPAASAFALQDVVPVLGTTKPVRVVLMSQLDANALKNSHIVYIGYISGLGMLGDRVFAASRVAPGGSYDELVDTKTDSHISQYCDGCDARWRVPRLRLFLDLRRAWEKPHRRDRGDARHRRDAGRAEPVPARRRSRSVSARRCCSGVRIAGGGLGHGEDRPALAAAVRHRDEGRADLGQRLRSQAEA